MARFDPGEREYTRTHPWINFRFDLRALNEVNWMRIGEALSKCDHIAGVPLAPGVAQEMHRIYLAKGIYATTSIEGNTLSEDEVRQEIDGKLVLPESQDYLGQEVRNIAEACEMVVRDLAEGNALELTPDRVMRFHEMILKNLPPEEDLVPGEIRQVAVHVGGVYRGAPAGDCEFLLAKLCDWLNTITPGSVEQYHRPMLLLRAILAHLYIAWIHPFTNGNGRTARLIEFQLLAAAGLPTPACHLLSNYYNRTRSRYYQVLRETSAREPYPVQKFVAYALDGFVEELREQLKIVRGHQMWSAWVNYVHEVIGGGPGTPAARRRGLVLALPLTPPGEYTPIVSVPKLTVDLAVLYASKQQKTVTRDLNELSKAGLIEKTKTGVRPLVETMSAFLPLRHASST